MKVSGVLVVCLLSAAFVDAVRPKISGSSYASDGGSRVKRSPGKFCFRVFYLLL